jgi:hypothetical protein
MNEMKTTVAAVALDGLYEVYTDASIAVKIPTDVLKVISLMPISLAAKGIDPGMVVANYDVDIVTTPEGNVIDIHLNGDSIGYHAVRNYCLTAEVKVPALLGQFEIDSLTLETFIESTSCYLLPLFGEEE